MPRAALFLHIQKTAGTTVQVAARRAYGNGNVCSHGDFLSLGREGCPAFPFLSGHFGFAFARPLMKDRYCFTFLRDPAERLLSLYAFCRAQPPEGHFLYEAASRLDLNGFLALGGQMPYMPALRNNMVWQMTYGWGHSLADGKRRRIDEFPGEVLLEQAKANLTSFDYVGLVETFDRDIANIFSALGADAPAPESHNATADRQTGQPLPETTKRLLAGLTDLDRLLFDHVRNTYRAGRRRTYLGRLLSRG